MYINYFSTKLEKCILKAAITLCKENLTFRANLYPPFPLCSLLLVTFLPDLNINIQDKKKKVIQL